ncbi:MAG: hypothetical protein BGP25_05035 [Lysobacterales bacterium 63-13]|nr:MAG: hypothetical protein BGP25_05035 [Xanthomonadales bacterium 63-13]
MGNSFVLELEGKRSVSIEEREGGLMITETKLNMKRKTSKERWVARVNCPFERVQLGRIAEVERLHAQGFVVVETPEPGLSAIAQPASEVLLYYRGAMKGVSALRDAVRRPESIPGITFTAEHDGWVLLGEERDPLESTPYRDRLVIPDEGTKAMICCTTKGTAMYGVLLALTQDGHGQLAIEEPGQPVLTMDASDLVREIHQAAGNTRRSLEAMGVIEPLLRNYAAAIGSVQHDHLVL